MINLALLPRVADSPIARAWTNPTWAAAFTPRPDLVATQTAWAVNPDISTATVEYRYGRGLVPGTGGIADYPPITAFGYFVLIGWFAGNETRWWLGYAGKPVTTPTRAAAGDTPAAGIQRIPCYGMERAFDLATIESTVHTDPITPEPPDEPAPFVRHASGATFNADRIGNQAAELVFDDDEPVINELGLFANPRDIVRQWNRRQIVQHLLTYHLPTPSGIASGLPWAIGDLSPIPTWDKPTVPTDGRTLASILDELLNRESLLGWRLIPTIVPGEPPTVTALTFQPFSRAAAPVTLPGLGIMPPNPVTHTLITAPDPLTDAEVTEDGAELVDQIIVQGPREIGIATLVYGHDLEDDWTEAQETKYKDGAKDEPGWADLLIHRRREANDRVREDPQLARVFSSWKIPKDWDGKADAVNSVFRPLVDDEGAETTYVPYLGNARMLEELPLYAEVDYSGPAKEVMEFSGRELRLPYVLIERPGTGRYDPVDRLGELRQGFNPVFAGLSFAVTAQVDNQRGPGIRLWVSSGPQHAIAGPDYLATPGNNAEIEQLTFYRFDYRSILATVGIQGDRRPFFAIPSNAALANQDVVTRRVLTIDDPALESIHIAPDTVIGLDPDGQPIRAEGGVLRDPEPILRAFATLAARSWTMPSFRVALQTSRLLSLIDAGHVLGIVDGQAIGATVAEVRIDAPTADGDTAPEAVTITITAAAERVDLLSLLRGPR